jgi:MoaA/NifB/PqqE/SkfB family radical SAM enzyme
MNKNINLDISNKCNLKCPACLRQTKFCGDVPGKDITLEEIEKITNYFEYIGFCGQISDPTFHPNLDKILKICFEKNIRVTMHVASTYRSMKWFKKMFLLSHKKNIDWIFALDGLPEDSHKYRINQDGIKMFEIMKLCSAMNIKTSWQYIIFNYNEDDIETCKKLSEENNIKFMLTSSSRWRNEMKFYKPTNPKYCLPMLEYK